MLNDTIVAISTGLVEQAISIIRLSGEQAIEVVDKIFDKDLTKAKSHTITYGFIKDEDDIVDEVLVSVFRAPKSYTMEDIVEINCHGGIYITKRILSLCIANGARLARPGEFTQRAFLNGRIDMSQAEGINDLIKANNHNKASSAIHSLKGSVTRLIDPLCEDLLDIIANIEVNIDYPEYDDVEVLTNQKIRPKVVNFLARIDDIIHKAQNSIIIKNGINTVILGQPNVGKSSLLNAMLQEDKAIVTNVAGTTRDLVEGEVTLNDVTLNLIDTAGIRDTNDIVEKIGIEKSIEALNNAQLVILVCDDKLDDEDKRLLDMAKDKPCLIVYNKKDLHDVKDGINISAINNDIEELVDAINDMFKEEIIDNKMDTLNNERQIGLAISARKHMLDVLKAIDDNVELDLVSIDLNMAYEDLKEILGHATREDLLDALFSKFCLGK
ncbi:MAG: tRNA uridine-5-carboxymethylaminomethyl(34) synthesis GTPase MnmE [Erysipelotrichaceae bacterium]|nr:tRNA uridine-5-carboxymethylaminomethyl(34) synthesis GTPase MnmE [Erysipelotrichaceae bacterium]